jgi:hypothetical protein
VSPVDTDIAEGIANLTEPGRLFAGALG